MSENNTAINRDRVSALETNKVLRNTYLLLSMTILFSAFTAMLSMQMELPRPGFFITLGVYIGLLFVTNLLKNSAWGLVSVFALTGFMGVTLGPLLSTYLALPNGSELIMQSLGATGIVFLTLSAYAIKSEKDFSYMIGFLITGLVVAILGFVGAYFLQLPGLMLAVSALVVLVMSGLILYDTSQIIHGGETNYIWATVGLYVSLFNIFVNLLHLLGAISGDD